MVATPVPIATRTVARQDRGKWHMGSGPNDGNPQGSTDWITLVLSNDDGGYTGGGLPDETVLAVLRLSCDVAEQQHHGDGTLVRRSNHRPDVGGSGSVSVRSV